MEIVANETKAQKLCRAERNFCLSNLSIDLGDCPEDLQLALIDDKHSIWAIYSVRINVFLVSLQKV